MNCSCCNREQRTDESVHDWYFLSLCSGITSLHDKREEAVSIRMPYCPECRFVPSAIIHKGQNIIRKETMDARVAELQETESFKESPHFFRACRAWVPTETITP